MRRINLLITFFCITVCSCSQSNKPKTTPMNNNINEILKQIKHYNTSPVYNLQINKNGCRVLVETNNFPYGILGNFYTNKGESMMIALNQYILKSGKQNIKLKIYSREGEDYITGFAHIDVKLYYNSNKDSGFNNFECLAKVGLPDDIVDKKLPYFEINIPFEAHVPYDFSGRLDSATDLKSIPDIEAKILEKFELKRNLIIDGNENKYNVDEKEGAIAIGSMLYATSAEFNEYLNVGREIYDLKLPGRKVMPIGNYEINFYNNNKLVTIVNKFNKEEILKVSYNYKDKPSDTWIPLVLYMPKGSSELKVW